MAPNDCIMVLTQTPLLCYDAGTMSFEHLTPDQLARIVTTGALILLGVLQIITPGCFSGVSMYFKGARAAFSSEQRERLAHILAARRDAEGDSDVYSRYAGGLFILMAPLALVPSVPYVLPYALSCLAKAAAVLLSYLRVRRATERRVAALVYRSPWASLPPLAIAAAAVCLLGATYFAAYPQFRFGVVVVIASSIALFGIAWRVAVSRTILFGNDSQLEYAIDEHVRFCRATSLVALACTPPTVLVLLAAAALPSSGHFVGGVTMAVLIGFVAAMLVSLNPMRKRIVLA